MGTTIKKVLLRAKSDGKQTVYFQLTKFGKVKRISSGYSVDPKFFDKAKGSILKGHPNGPSLTNLIHSKQIEIESKILKIESDDPGCNIEQILIFLNTGNESPNFFEFAEKTLSRFSRPEKHNDLRATKTAINRFSKFLGDKNVCLGQINLKTIIDFDSSMRNIPLKGSTRKTTLRRIKTIFNIAIKTKEIKSDQNPFIGFDLPSEEKTIKQRLSSIEIGKIKNTETNKGSWPWHAKNTFLFQYFGEGIRISDVIMMRWINVQGDRLKYICRKTGKPFNIPIREELMEIIDNYQGKDSEFIFNLFSSKQKLNPDIHIGTITARINKGLKQIGLNAEIPIKITTHTARHSFAKTASESVGIRFVSNMLGHSNIEETMNYIGSIQDDEMDAERKKIKL